MMAAPSMPVAHLTRSRIARTTGRVQSHQIDGDKSDLLRTLAADEGLGHEAVADVRGPGSPPPVPTHCAADRRRDVGGRRAKGARSPLRPQSPVGGQDDERGARAAGIVQSAQISSPNLQIHIAWAVPRRAGVDQQSAREIQGTGGRGLGHQILFPVERAGHQAAPRGAGSIAPQPGLERGLHRRPRPKGVGCERSTPQERLPCISRSSAAPLSTSKYDTSASMACNQARSAALT